MADEIVKDFPCPKCGSKDRFMSRIAQKEKDKGVLPEGLIGVLEVRSITVANPKPVIPYIPGMVKPCGNAYFDICFECGTYYCFRVEESMAILSRQQGMPTGHP